MENLNNINSYEVNNKINSGVDLVFEENPELAAIGSMEQYSEYLDNTYS